MSEIEVVSFVNYYRVFDLVLKHREILSPVFVKKWGFWKTWKLNHETCLILVDTEI